MGKFNGKRCRLLTMFGLTTSFFIVEIVVGYITNSMALVADSFHMLSDVAALVIAFLSVQMSPKKWSKNTFGWARAEVLGALVNAVFLVALCFSILVESLKRIHDIEEIENPQLVLYVGAFGLLVNLVGVVLFCDHGHDHIGHLHAQPGKGHAHLHELMATDDNENDESLKDQCKQEGCDKSNKTSASQMNMRGVFLHVLADALGSVIVIVSAAIIWQTDWKYRFYLDPALSILMVILIMKSVWPLLVESAMILLQTVPTHIDMDRIKQQLLTEVDGVLAVHEFHVWQLTGNRIIASAHICCRNLHDYIEIAKKVKEIFHNQGIHSTTIQPEFLEYADGVSESSNCVLDCPPNQDCSASTCCPPPKKSKKMKSHEAAVPDVSVVISVSTIGTIDTKHLNNTLYDGA
ncbi:unnamed protein product [Darwinula stevensoni]|uniref:Zinc transporter 1 n=1 Tax=Darwinula stevensoni TaxID=69355 RepID=A0A7R8X619_9CRUS|nr:unnamed protein product [Darwinula stevensoni]CAG0885272.1 unnamed protein product [Darwinula stevensoni]